MTRHPAPARLLRCGLEYAETNRLNTQTLHLPAKTLAVLLGDALRPILQQISAQRRAQGGAS